MMTPRLLHRIAVAVTAVSLAELAVLVVRDGRPTAPSALVIANLAALWALVAGYGDRPVSPATTGPTPIASRLMTAVLGWCLGGLTVLLAAPEAVVAQAALAAPVVLLALPLPWSLGYASVVADWERRHWVAYGIATAALLAAALVVPVAGAGAAALAFAAGVVVTLALIAVAFLRPLSS